MKTAKTIGLTFFPNPFFRRRKALLVVGCALALPLFGSQILQAGAIYTVNSTADAPDADPLDGIARTVSGDTTLRAAIMQANYSGGGTIILPAGTYTITRVGYDDNAIAGDLDISTDITIQGAGSGVTIVDGNASVTHDRVFQVMSAVKNFTLSGMTIRNGESTSTNETPIAGGGLCIVGPAHVLLSDVIFDSNTAQNGGGVYASLSSTGGSIEMDNVIVRSNSVVAGGVGAGGGVYVHMSSSQSQFILQDSQINNNTADGTGGGIYIDGNSTNQWSIQRCEIYSNTAASGGGVGNFVPLTLSGSYLHNNSVTFDGGAIEAYSPVVMSRTTLDANSAGRFGGGIFLLPTASNPAYSDFCHIEESTLSGNFSTYGGAIYHDGFIVPTSLLHIINSTISGNAVSKNGEGGGIYSYFGPIKLLNSTVANNKVLLSFFLPRGTGKGGGFFIRGSATDTNAFRAENSLIANNARSNGITLDTADDGFTTTDGTNSAAVGGELSFNLIRATTNFFISGPQGGNIFGQDPLLGPLQDNGGPTKTQALMSGSPAINAANGDAPTLDQRDFIRPNAPDIGAFEFGGQAMPATKIMVLSGNLAFGNVTNGTTAQSTLTISNSGNATMTVNSITYPNGFSGAWAGTIPSGGFHRVLVTFAPTAAVTYGGNLTVTADQTSGSNVYPISGKGVPGPAVVTLDPASLNQVYDGTPKLVSVSTTPPGLAVNITYSGSTSPPTGVGSYAIVATITDPGYTGSASGTLTVTPAELTVTASNASRLYGSANPSFTAVISGFVNGDTATVVSGAASLNTTATVGSPVGSYAITPALGSLSAANYTFANFVNGTLTVGPAPLTVTANNASRAYGSANPSFTADVSGFVNGDTASVVSGAASLTTTATAGSPVGSYAITPSLGSLSAANYTFANFVNGTLTVGPAALTVTANNANRTYGSANPTFTADISGFVNGDTASVLSGAASLNTTATAASPVGSYAITPSLGSLSAANYTFANFVNGTLSVTPVLLTVSAVDTNRPYGAANPPFSASYSGFANGDTITALQGSPSFTPSATPTSPPGSYAIVVAQGTLTAQNYNFTFINGTLTVTSDLLNTIQITWAANGGLVLSMQGIAGSPYQVRVSNDLVNWTPLTNVTADATGSFHVPIPISTRGGDVSFYRVLSQ